MKIWYRTTKYPHWLVSGFTPFSVAEDFEKFRDIIVKNAEYSQSLEHMREGDLVEYAITENDYDKRIWKYRFTVRK